MLVPLPVTVVGLLSLLVKSALAEYCVPGVNCHAPHCRCAFQLNPPGGIPKAQAPQMVLLSFQYVVNASNEKDYTSLFEGLLNPNGCPARGTLFVQETDTSPTTVKSLHAAGHEIGVTTPTGKSPSNDEEWKGTYTEVTRFLRNASGANTSDVIGCRAPGFEIGDDFMFEEMAKAGLAYDSSCVLYDSIFLPVDIMWPYTNDYPQDQPMCNFGRGPYKPKRGVWQFHMPYFFYGKNQCSKLSECTPYLKDGNDTANFLHINFNANYKHNRTPFVLAPEPDWFEVPFQVEGIKKFLHDIRSRANDTWILTHRQALDWMLNPVPTSATGTYKPWAC